MAELRELLEPIPRPPPGHQRVRRRTALAGTGRYAALFVTAVAAWLAFLLLPPRLALPLEVLLLRRYGLVAVFLVVFAVLLARMFRLRRRVLQNHEGLFLAASGRRMEATVLYERLARGVRGSNPYHALFVGNCGVCAGLAGNFERARPLLAEPLRSGWFDAPRVTTPAGYFAAWLARTYALEGDLRTASAWRELAVEMLPPGRKGVLLLADAVILIRSGHPGAAADAISAAWMGAEGELPAHERRALRAVQAFALHRGGRAAEVEPALAMLWPPVPNQLGYLAAHWPELERFLTARSLTR